MPDRYRIDIALARQIAAELLNPAGRLGQAHAVLEPKHARGADTSMLASCTRAFGSKARSPDPITLPEPCWLGVKFFKTKRPLALLNEAQVAIKFDQIEPMATATTLLHTWLITCL
ncbi:MAG: hypothetical protein AUK50_06930 [Comamonadaceae bacterium CG2_30_57_122]|nr:MAG: hypothetical protein AUK50_06930 [Comamonadaceae bacterium CG2_30_57_122]